MTKSQEQRLKNLEPTQRAIILSNYQSTKKSTAVFALLALFPGGLGVHHFYMGRTLAGVLSLLLCWTFIPAMFAMVEVLFCWLIVGGYNERQLSSQLNLMGV